MACLFQKPTKGQDGTLRDQSRKKMPIFYREYLQGIKILSSAAVCLQFFFGVRKSIFLQVHLPITFHIKSNYLTAISRKNSTSFLGLSRLAILAFFSKILVVCHNPMLSQPLCWRCELIWTLEKALWHSVKISQFFFYSYFT